MLLDTTHESLKIKSSTAGQQRHVALRPSFSEPLVSRRDSTFGGACRSGAIAVMIDEIRRGLTLVSYVRPESIETPAALLAGLDAEARDLARASLVLPGDRLRPLIRRLARKAAEAASGPVTAESGEPATCAPEYDVHDGFFGLTRTDAPTPYGFLAGILQAIEMMHRDLRAVSTRLSDSDLAVLDSGLRRIVALAAGEAAPEGRVFIARTHKAPHERASARRWLRGHHVFAALSQGMILSFNQLIEATATDARGGMEEAADAIVAMMLASARALEWTGDFPAPHYENVIRPAMQPPHLPAGFSGVNSRDHRQLVRRMKDARSALERLRLLSPGHHAAILEALAGVYDSHKTVCAVFVGTDQSSLLMASDLNRSSVTQLENFKTSRLRMLGGGACPHAAALGA